MSRKSKYLYKMKIVFTSKLSTSDAAQLFDLNTDQTKMFALLKIFNHFGSNMQKNEATNSIAQVVSAMKNNTIFDIWKYLNVIVCFSSLCVFFPIFYTFNRIFVHVSICSLLCTIALNVQ